VRCTAVLLYVSFSVIVRLSVVNHSCCQCDDCLRGGLRFSREPSEVQPGLVRAAICTHALQWNAQAIIISACLLDSEARGNAVFSAVRKVVSGVYYGKHGVDVYLASRKLEGRPIQILRA